MTEAMPRVSAVEVTRAVRDSGINGLQIHAGEVMALVDDEIVQTGDDEASVIEAVLRNHDTPPELVTVYWGAQVDGPAATLLVDRLRSGFPDVEFELHRGGQDHYPYILSLERGRARARSAQGRSRSGDPLNPTCTEKASPASARGRRSTPGSQ